MISFIIIGYNVEKYIEKCINSVIKQTYKDIEVIFVDDGSTDNTRKIVEGIFNEDKRCKYIYQKNKGANAARITGYKNANGKYIAFIDGDDWIDESLAKTAIEYFQMKDLDFICYNFNFVYENGKCCLNTKFEETVYRENCYLESILLSKTPHYLWNKVYRCSFLQKMNFDKIPQITMGDDLMANVRMGIEKPNVIAINKPLYYYYLKNSSVSQQFNPKYIEIIKALNDIEKSLEKADLKSKYEKMIEYQYFRMFYYYVVKSKHRKTYIQISINDEWSNKRIEIKENKYIREFIENIKTLERILLYSYNMNFNLGYYISRLYLLFTGK